MEQPRLKWWAGKDICGALYQRGWKYHDTGLIFIELAFVQRIPEEAIENAGGPRRVEHLIAKAVTLPSKEALQIKRELTDHERQVTEYRQFKELADLKARLAHACELAATIPDLVEKIRRAENGFEEGVCPHCGASLSIENHETDQCSKCRKDLGQETGRGRNPLK